MTDPYHEYAAEVSQSLSYARKLASNRDFPSLQSTLDGLRFDLDDLRASVQAAGSNFERFGLSSSEVIERQRFIQQADTEVVQLSNLLLTPSSDQMLGKTKVQDPEADPVEADKASTGWVEEPMDEFTQFEMSHQDTLFAEQDEALGLLGGTLNSLQRQAGQFGDELGLQSELFQTFDAEIDQTQSKLQRVMGRMDTLVRHTDDRLGGWCIWLLIVALMLLLLIAILI